MPRHINDYDFSKLNDERLEKEIKEFINQKFTYLSEIYNIKGIKKNQG